MTEKHGKLWVSLRTKLVIVLLLATILGFVSGAGFRLLGEHLVNQIYMAPERAQRRCSAMMDSFQQMVEGQQLSTSKKEPVYQWVRQRRFLYLVITSGGEELISYGWLGAVQVSKRLNDILSETEPGDSREDYAVPGAAFRTVHFSDRTCRVLLCDCTDASLLVMIRWLGYALGTVIVLAVTLLYHKMAILRFIRLTRQVEEVAGGNLQGVIDVHSGDEIGDLSDHVCAMRNTIMEKMREEQMAWKANSTIMTHMGHDIRTSLTVLTGFLELMEEGDYSEDQSYLDYLGICRRNAAQLKVQADKLLQYSLDFGYQGAELKLEVVNAKTLLSQLIGEHVMLMHENGWHTVDNPLDQMVQVRVDTVVMKRLMDNLFSNVKKYADPSRPVELSGRLEGDSIHVRMRNAVDDHAARAEGYGIGLKTCERMMKLMGGRFSAREKDRFFQVDLFLPVWRGETGEGSPE